MAAESPTTASPTRRAAAEVPGRPCSIASALTLIGERWTLLAVREISLGNTRFGRIASATGAPRDVLTARLRSMEANGIVYREPYSEHPPRYEYRLTEAGRDLLPLLNAVRAWGDRWVVDEPPVAFTHTCGHDIAVVPRCPHCDVDIDLTDRDAVHASAATPEWLTHNHR
ncbi:winged helix-turn-helix transcriptional regulator [Nocardia stercoris]|uniref:Transcriptional regulator n=1 Tax=Nocardia stercoris TaxID=2483361 RepID=A0A3M2KUJ9_9NOCA|nr:helix-turn-helix domain-containing protein [Nocardia stercoris]RMI28130.1 transcriptional regulator [Nocardia stercoris]